MSKTDPGALVVLSFDAPLKAREALLAVQRLEEAEVVLLHDAVFFDKDAEGNATVTETVDTPPAEAAARSAFWGALLGTLVAGPVGTLVGGAVTAGFGALTAKLIDIGIPDAKVKEIEDALSPGNSALAVLVSHVNEEAFERELARFAGATLVQSSLSAETVQRLRSVLAGGAA